MKTKAWICVVVALLLSACSIHKKESAYAGPGGSMGACKQMCDRDNDVCSDPAGAREDLTMDRPQGMTNSCERQLKQCLSLCASNLNRTPQTPVMEDKKP